MQSTRNNRAKRGQSLAEYGLILALVTVFCLAALQMVGQNMGDMFNKVATAISSAIATAP